MNEALVICLIIFLGAMVQGMAAFGFALVSAPILMLVMPHTEVPPLLVLIGLLNNLMVLYEARKHLKVSLIWPLIIGAVIGLPIGVWVLERINAEVFKLGIGVIVVIAAVLMFIGLRASIKANWRTMVPVGWLSGFLSGSTALSGPPVILFFANQDVDKQSFRANLIAYFTLLNIASIIAFFGFRLMTRPVLVNGLIAIIPLVIGSILGILIARRINETVFKRAILVIIAMIGLYLVIQNGFYLIQG